MPCYTPLRGYYRKPSAAYPKGGFTTRASEAYTDRPLTIACGQCIGCKLERSRQWAVRCVHEKQLHNKSCFITLTYNDDNLPFGGSLVVEDFQKFMKRLRKKCGQMRFFHCGEYGETTQRPHYHALLFGWQPSDPELFSKTSEYTLYESKLLTETWGLGHASFGEITFESAAYVARYCTKKITGPNAENHYQRVDPETGEIYNLKPEYCTMSRRPGIGLPWLEKYGSDAYSKDEVILRGLSMKPPRAYDKQFEITDPATWQSVRQKRASTNNPYKGTTPGQNGPKPKLKRGVQLRTSRHDYAALKIQAKKLRKREIE